MVLILFLHYDYQLSLSPHSSRISVVVLIVSSFIVLLSFAIQAYSTVGTPDYIAPEVLLKKGYGMECDWLVDL